LTHRQIAETDEPNGTHTQYLVIYGTGAVTCDVHEMIARVVADEDVPLRDPHEITGIMLILADKEAPVFVEVKDASHGSGIEWEISFIGATTCLEYVCYADESRGAYVQDDVYVEGFMAAPDVPELVAAS
jgi:hypothetical protein